MDADQRKAGLDRMRAYLPGLLPALRLQHWQISVKDEPPESEDASASVLYNEHDWWAFILCSDYFLESPPDRQRLHLVHELAHLYLRGIDMQHQSLITHWTSSQWQLVDNRFTYEVELAVDALACVIAPFLPLPPAEDDACTAVAAVQFVGG